MDETNASASIETLVNEMKQKGIESGIVRKDGILAYGTVIAGDATAQNVASVSNTTESILSKVKDSSKEIEIALDNSFYVIIPLKEYLLCASVKDREEKKILREYAEKLRAVL